jgi:putative membrane protein
MARRNTARHLLQLGLIAGLAATVLLLAWSGAGAVLAAFVKAGWAIALIVPVRLAAVSVAGLGWRCLLPPDAVRPATLMVGLRLVREGLNCLLPAGQVGGEVVGARLLALSGLGAGFAAATVLVDMLVQLFTQLIFAGLGFAALLSFAADRPAVPWIGLGLIVGAVTVAAFFLAQRLGLFLLVERFLIWLAERSGWHVLGGLVHLHRSIQAIYRQPTRLLASSAIHLLAWTIGALEIWIALRFMGHPVGLIEALVLESLVQAIRSAAFFVPSGLGAQEGGFVLLGGLVGLPAEAALALSLVKRVPELAIGVLAMAAWQTVEARHASHRTGWPCRPAEGPI